MASASSPTIPLFPGEKVARLAPATGHFSTRAKFPGVLHLTNQRLVFLCDGNGRNLDVRLREVRDVTPFSQKLFGLIPTRRALRVSVDRRYVSEEPWFTVDDAEAWNLAIMRARADAPASPPDLATLLSAAEAEGRDAVSREAIGGFLSYAHGFPGGFWHPQEDDGLLNVIGGWITDAGLPGDLMADEKLRAELKRIAESMAESSDAAEDQARRRQIHCVAARVNSTVGPAAATRRLYQFAEDIPGWDADEPVWLFLNADERARLLALGIVHPLPTVP